MDTVFRHNSANSDQEVAASHGWVQDLQVQDSLGQIQLEQFGFPLGLN